MSRRTEKIGEQLRAEIARILLEDVTDPRIPFITLTRVDVAPDLSNAIAFWSAIEVQDADSAEEIQQILNSAASFVRRQLSRALALRRVPAIHFRFDPSLALGADTLSLLRSIADDEKT
jgi:ribosome-binding factor A